MKPLCLILLAAIATPCVAADLTGNWAVRDRLPDGTSRNTYLDLHQEGSRITGTIRSGQYYFKIVESTGGPTVLRLSAA